VKLWGGRFRKPTAPELEKLGQSIEFDRRLGLLDVRINRAYVAELRAIGLVDAAEEELITRGLTLVEEKLSASPPPKLNDEDIHTAVERLLGEAIVELGGDPSVAGKLPTGRSRNDLAASEFRLYLASAIESAVAHLLRLQRSLLDRAKTTRDELLPGYTHLRRGQPVVFAQYLLAYFWAIDRDRARFRAARGRCLSLPLGAGALAGNPFPVDRGRLAKTLGFEGVSPNSIDAVSSRDFALEFLSAAALLGTNLSRMSEDLILWASAEFGFITIDESYATGSSLMPQKQNPDGLELVRGKTGRLVGNLMSLLTTVKGLPTGYQRDLQEDKEPVFDTVDTLELVLPVMDGIVRTLGVRSDAMRAALSHDLLATDLAEHLVRKGVPFRETHEIAGRVLSLAAEKGVTPPELSLEELRQVSDAFDESVSSVWDFRASVEHRATEGGVAAKAIAQQIERAESALS
jgi:argininosuccinate lyase